MMEYGYSISYNEDTPMNLVNHLKRKIDNGYLRARNSKSVELYGQVYNSLPSEKKQIINEIIPQSVSVRKIKSKFAGEQSAQPLKVHEVLPSNQQYDIPKIRFHEKWINLNGKRCELEELASALEDLLPNDGTDRLVELTVYSTVSKERVEVIFAVLENVEDLQIIRKDVTPPPPPPLRPITLKRDGKIIFNNQVMTIEQLQTFLVSMEEKHRMSSNKNDEENYRLRATVKIEYGADMADVQRLKTVMKMGNFKHVNYSTTYPENLNR